MIRSILTTLAYPYFRKDMEELQRYRNVTHSINRWCAADKVADAVTEEIMLVAKDEKAHNEGLFREKLKALQASV